MTSGWSRRRASEAGLLLCAVLLLAAGAAASRAAGEPVVTHGASGRSLTARERQWLAEDRVWLAGRPAPADSLLTDRLPDDGRRWRLSAGPADSIPAVRSEASLLRQRWHDRGYLEAEVAAAGDTLFVTPGAVWTIGGWDVGGEDFPGRGALLDRWLPRPGARLDAGAVDEAVAGLLRDVGDEGHPFPRWVVRGAAADPAARSATIRATLLPGARAWLGPVGSDLENPRAAGFLRRASGLRPGAPFNQTDLERARRRLQDRDLYAAVGEPVVHVTTARDTVGVHFPVQPRRKQNRLQVVLGLSRRDDEQGSRLSGEVDLHLPDLAGSGRALRVGWRDDGQGRSRFGFDYAEPLAFGTPLDLAFSLEQEVEEGSFTRFRLDHSWRLPVVALWGVELGLGWDRATYPAGPLATSHRTRARAAVVHRRGDRTRSGWSASLGVESVRRRSTLRSEDELATSSLSADLDQRIYALDLEGELWLSRTLSVAGRSAYRQLEGQEEQASVAELFAFGGAASLRGYREQEFRGTRASWGGVELRAGAPRGSRLYTFWDLGYLELWTPDPASADPAARLRREDWHRGFGLGLLARTAGGDISLAVGFPGTVDFDLAKLHVTLLESF